MENSGQPTKRTRHIDIKYFAIHAWIDNDLIILKIIGTNNNKSDGMKKNLSRTRFHRHIDYMMGKTVPEYSEEYKIIPEANLEK